MIHLVQKYAQLYFINIITSVLANTINDYIVNIFNNKQFLWKKNEAENHDSWR